jgi:hypothetical protein
MKLRRQEGRVMAGWGICDDGQQHHRLLLCAALYHAPGDVTPRVHPRGLCVVGCLGTCEYPCSFLCLPAPISFPCRRTPPSQRMCRCAWRFKLATAQNARPLFGGRHAAVQLDVVYAHKARRAVAQTPHAGELAAHDGRAEALARFDGQRHIFLNEMW